MLMAIKAPKKFKWPQISGGRVYSMMIQHWTPLQLLNLIIIHL
eukprot:09983.XXX_156189_156317_1 [CDS] Oithona nana genome sequencing.